MTCIHDNSIVCKQPVLRDKSNPMQGIVPDATISTSLSPDGKLEIHSYIPDGIEIASGEHGRSLYATQYFAKGSVLYRGYGALVKMEDIFLDFITQQSMSREDEDLLDMTASTVSSWGSEAANEYIVVLYKADGTMVDTVVLNEMHSVEDVVDPMAGVRQMYGFDAYMDHSCSPNVYTPLFQRTSDRIIYNCCALKDIYPGDKITMDYDTFEWEADGHTILECGCGAPNCRGQVMGFKNLDLQEKVRIMKYCEPEIIDRFFRETPHVKLTESYLPPGVSIRESDQTLELSLVADRDFEVDEEIYTNNAKILSKQEVIENTFIQKVNHHFRLLNPGDHFVHRPNYVEHLGFDTFQDHACDPNTYQVYHGTVTYSVRAKKTIRRGEKLTIDYAGLKNEADGVEHVPSSQFRCRCGSLCCRGLILA